MRGEDKGGAGGGRITTKTVVQKHSMEIESWRGGAQLPHTHSSYHSIGAREGFSKVLNN
jgi:hypothetical protein